MAVFLANERSRLVFKDCRHHGPRRFGTVRAFPAAAIGSAGRDRVVLGMVQEPSSNTPRNGRAVREPHTRGQTPHTHIAARRAHRVAVAVPAIRPTHARQCTSSVAEQPRRNFSGRIQMPP